MKKKSANAYNIIRILLYIILVGIPIRFAYDGFGTDRTILGCILMFIAAGAAITLLEQFVFSKWRKKLDTFPAVTQGNMYNRTTESYKSANDTDEENEKHQS